MRIILTTFAAASVAALVALPTGGRLMAPEEAPAPERVTVIYKNLSSPTLEELGQKAGDPSNADVPDELPFLEARKGQWI